MKKVFLLCLTILVIACVSSSCSRVCTCKTYVLGLPIDEFEEEIDLGDKCSSINNYDEDLQTGKKCR